MMLSPSVDWDLSNLHLLLHSNSLVFSVADILEGTLYWLHTVGPTVTSRAGRRVPDHPNDIFFKLLVNDC